MLQLYMKSIHLIVNNEHVALLSRSSNIVRDDQMPTEEWMVQDATWDEMWTLLESNKLPVTYRSTTWPRKREYISAVGYYSNSYIPKYFRESNPVFSIVVVYVLNKYYTMEDVMKKATADQAVQWFKERGLAVCPYPAK